METGGQVCVMSKPMLSAAPSTCRHAEFGVNVQEVSVREGSLTFLGWT